MFNVKKTNTTVDIHDRIFRHVVTVLRLIKNIPKTPENLLVINQLGRSITSVGANDNEADSTNTKNDFIHCEVIVRKEIKESNYWLKIIYELNPNLQNQISPLLQEGEEIYKITNAIIYNSRKITKNTN
jgi:four helix bundle protein